MQFIAIPKSFITCRMWMQGFEYFFTFVDFSEEWLLLWYQILYFDRWWLLGIFQETDPKFAEFRQLFSKARSVLVLTGAGISAESGVPTFRGAGGFWRQFQATVCATLSSRPPISGSAF